MIEDLLINEHVLFSIPSVKHLNYTKILALCKEDFAAFYLELMAEYRDHDGWWSPGNVPSCFLCHEEISGPENLRRYYGRSLHPECFREVYKMEGKETGQLMQYFDRVANLGS